MRVLLPPFIFTDHEAAIGDVPSVGQHTDEVLAEIGFSAQRIAMMREGVRYDRI